MNLSELQADQVELPIWQALAPLREALSRAHTSLLVAPPGAGKSTIVPLALLDEAWVQGRKILVLEPRRLAARALAWRMASLSGQPLGELVGLRTRDDTQVGPSTRIEILTEALLTRRIQHAPELEDVAVVIFDEFHERSLHADLGLALVRDVQAGLRDDLRVLLMSATLEQDNLAARLGASVVQTQGRSYPVEVRYAKPRSTRLDEGVATAVRAALKEHPGDILVFLPGEAEIRAVARRLDALGPGIVVHALYGRLPRAAQQAAIASISFIPVINLDEDIIATRFGKASTQLPPEGVDHFLHPDQRLAISLRQNGKKVLHYLAPPPFSNRTPPLLK